MKIRQYIIGLLLAIISVSVAAQSNTVEVRAEIDSMILFIGEQATLSIEATQPRSKLLQFPIFSDNIIDKLELVETLTPDTVPVSDGIIQVTNRYKVTAFDSAVIYMPGFPVIDNTDTLLTNALTLKILDMPVDTTQMAIADIKGIYKPPFDWMHLLTIIAWCLLAAAAVAGIIFLVIKLRKKPAEEAEQPAIDPRSAYEIAMTDLQTLQEKKLWQEGLNKEYHSELTDIVKQYISRRFSISAVEQSTEDLLSTFRTDKTLRDMKTEISLLSSILKLADLVKFAKMLPLPADNEHSMKDALQFVELTKPAEEPKPGQETPEAASAKQNNYQ